MKKTKIICTIGPACNNEQTLREMIGAGMNVARVNFSHGTDEEHIATFKLLKKVRKEVKCPLGILLDTKGPEYRIKSFKNGKIFLKNGADFTFTTKLVEGDETKVSVSYKNLTKDLVVGDRILLNNGLLIFEVKEILKTDVKCKVIVGGELSNNKSMNFPKKELNHKYLSEQDKHDLMLGIQEGVDFIACSFISRADNIKDVRSFLDKNGGTDIEIIAKIENQSGIDNIDEILECCEGIMVARGDLGVEISQEKLPFVQKCLIKKAIKAGKIVITATEMLESMIKSPRPTRAEVSDVANAIYDGSSAIMLSGETAAGIYPVKSVETMSIVAEETERNIRYANRFEKMETNLCNNLDAVSRACVSLGIDTNSKVIVACSKTGRTIKQVSKFHGPSDVLGLITNQDVYFKLSLYFGVNPILVKDYGSLNNLFNNAKELAKKEYGLKKGDNIIITGGTASMTDTNLLKVEKI